MRNVFVLAAFCLMASPILAQTTPAETVATDTPAFTTRVAPQEIKEVIAEGKAAIGVGGVLGARRAAEAQALRQAVEKALGIYVSAHSLTQNYTLVRDQILTRSEGFATLKEVIREEVGTDEVSVTLRALVTLKPLNQQLKALKLTRAVRLFVQVKADGGARQALAGSVTALENRLAEAGFVVVDDVKNADVIVKLTPRFTTTHETPLDTAAGPMTMYAIDGQLTVQAVRSGTGEIVAAYAAQDTANHVNLTTARGETAQTALTAIGPALVDALMVLPAAQSQSVALVVGNLRSATQVGQLEDALERLTGVQKVTRRSFGSGTAAWEIDITSDAATLLARDLEQFPALRPFRLTVTSENGAKITATAASRVIRTVKRNVE